MTTLRCGLAALVFASVFDLGAAQQPGEPVPTIKEIMLLAHRGCRDQSSHLSLARQHLAREEPDWTMVEEHSRALMLMGQLLAKNTPRKGSQESWRQFTEQYIAGATQLTEAAERQDKALARQLVLRVANCSGCHRAHK